MRGRRIVGGRNDYDKGVTEGQMHLQERALLPPGAIAVHRGVVRVAFDDTHGYCDTGGTRANSGKIELNTTMRPGWQCAH